MSDFGRGHRVTPRSPLGLAVLEKRAGENCQVSRAGRSRERSIERLAWRAQACSCSTRYGPTLHGRTDRPVHFGQKAWRQAAVTW